MATSNMTKFSKPVLSTGNRISREKQASKPKLTWFQ